MNMNYMLAGTTSTNPILVCLKLFLPGAQGEGFGTVGRRATN
jgi:hypothetical protein